MWRKVRDFQREAPVRVSDLFNLKLKRLQKKYGGSIRNCTWSMRLGLLGLTPIEASVCRDEDGAPPIVSISWESMLLIMYQELHIDPGTNLTKIRWFMRYLDVLDPKIRENSPRLFEEAAELTQEGKETEVTT